MKRKEAQVSDSFATGKDGREICPCSSSPLDSPDLAHGLAVQLPQYMRAKTTDYGLYVVLDFGAGYEASGAQFQDHFPTVYNHFILGRPKQAEIRESVGETTAPFNPNVVLEVCAKEVGKFVRCIVLRLFKQDPPSKK